MRILLSVAALAVGAGLIAAPVSAQQEEHQLDADIRMFTVLAAINVAGYDQGVGSGSDSLVRQAVRAQLADFKGESLTLLKNFYEQFEQDDPSETLSQYVSYALICEPPPTFELKAELPTDLPPDVRRLRGLGRVLEQFYREAPIERLWEQYQPAYEQEMDRYQAILVPVLFKAAGYLGLSLNGREARGFKIYFDLLGAPNKLNTRLYRGNVRVVVHPYEKPPVEEIRRVFLLHLLDRLSIRYAEAVGKKSVLARYALFAPALDEVYKSNFQILVTKCLVNAVETRLLRISEEEKRARVERDLREGWILTPYFYEQLPDFEEDPRGMNKYYEEMIDGIDLGREAARLQEVTFSEPERADPRRPAPRRVEPLRPQLSESDKMLQRGEFLLRQEMLEEARKAFNEALEESGGRNGQASYGLARVAISEADPDLARELFRQAAETAEDAHIKAMSYVYIGRIEDIVGNREQAIANYKLALEAGDPADRTRRLALEGIEDPFSRPGEEEEPGDEEPN